MLIKGFQPLTLIDYPGQLAAIIFFGGCNLRCHYCYNKLLALNSPELPIINEDQIFSFLENRNGLIDGVVITGGEPTLQEDLTEFIKKIKQLGFLVKLDTNGTNPDIVKELIDNKLVDYIAMDIKNIPESYEKTTTVGIDIKNVMETVKIIMGSGIDYEFRTTVLPKLISKKDFLKIGEWLKGAKKYCIQQFKKTETIMDMAYLNEEPYTEEDLDEIKKILLPYFKNIEVRA